MAAAITGGDVELLDTSYEPIAAVARVLEGAGVEVTPTETGIRVRRMNGRLTGVDVMTEPFPGFPTDMQAQMMALMTTADGAAMITETIFENRFMHVPELCRMGANINVHGASADGARASSSSPALRSWRPICGPPCRSSWPGSPRRARR